MWILANNSNDKRRPTSAVSPPIFIKSEVSYPQFHELTPGVIKQSIRAQIDSYGINTFSERRVGKALCFTVRSFERCGKE
jgi:hypothetical protein